MLKDRNRNNVKNPSKPRLYYTCEQPGNLHKIPTLRNLRQQESYSTPFEGHKGVGPEARAHNDRRKRHSQGWGQAEKYKEWRRNMKKPKEIATQVREVPQKAATTLKGTKEVPDLSEENYREWKRKLMQEEGITAQTKSYAMEDWKVGLFVPRTTSTTTLRKEKETKDQGTQTGDIRNETWKVRPGEANLLTLPKKRARNWNWKKIEERSRKLNENFEGYWPQCIGVSPQSWTFSSTQELVSPLSVTPTSLST